MLSQLIKNSRKLTLFLPYRLATITHSKTLVEKKKLIYQSQKLSDPFKDQNSKASLSQKEGYEREIKFQEIMFNVGKQLHQYLDSRTGTTEKNINVSPILTRAHNKLKNQLGTLNALELVNYIEIIKNICLHKMEHLSSIQAAYTELSNIAVQNSSHKEEIAKHMQSLWKKGTPFQMQIRSVCLIEYISEQSRYQYFSKVTPLIRYMKSANILIILYEKWRFRYSYSYQLLDQIHNNQYFITMDQINQCYLKMLFIKSIRGQFIANEDGMFGTLLKYFQEKPSIVFHSAFDKCLQIMHLQGSLVQTQSTRYQLENSLNTFINIAKNQNYDQNIMKLQQLVQIYLGFEQTNSTGQILLNQITYLAKISKFNMNKQNFPLFKQLLQLVLNNIEPKLKYERRDNLNKEYTFDSVNFLKQFLPSYIKFWPDVIFQVNHAHHQLFSNKQPGQNSLVDLFQKTFNGIVERQQNNMTLNGFLKILRFVDVSKDTFESRITPQTFKILLQKFQKANQNKKPTKQDLQALYYTLKLLDINCKQKAYKTIIQRINSKIIQREMEKQMEQERHKSMIITLNDNIIWLSMCSAQIKKHDFQINQSIVEVFVNTKLYFLLNSLSYEQVYQILVYSLSLSRLSIDVYERLLLNLSTFIIYINEQNKKNSLGTGFYLNHKFTHLYKPIIDLLLKNKQIFRKIKNKQAFKFVQIFIIKELYSYQSHQILMIINILADPAYLNISLNKYISDAHFSARDIESIGDTYSLRAFEYYNKSILRYFEGKYNESQIRNRLKDRVLGAGEIHEYFSKIEVYKTILLDGDLNIRFNIPQPDTNILEFKYLYICQKIFQKIQTSISLLYSQDQSQAKGNQVEPRQVDLLDEKLYIQKQLLMEQNRQNQFRINNRSLPKYTKVQVWKSYTFFNKNYAIDGRDIFSSSKQLADQILIKIIKGINGKYEKVREALKQFAGNEDFIEQLRQARINFEQHGAALDFKKASEQHSSLTLLCANNTNYKILYICAYLMQLHGVNVRIVRENHSVSSIVKKLKTLYQLPQVQEEQLKGQEEEQIEVQQ